MAISIFVRKSDNAALVDEEFSYFSKYKWVLSHNGYPIRHSEKNILMHHEIMGKPKKGFVVDHINRNKLDNRRSNLRIIPMEGNAQNRSTHRNNVTGIRGVYLRKDTGKYLAHCTIKGKMHRLGYYDDPVVAGNVAKAFREKNMIFNVE